MEILHVKQSVIEYSTIQYEAWNSWLIWIIQNATNNCFDAIAHWQDITPYTRVNKVLQQQVSRPDDEIHKCMVK